MNGNDILRAMNGLDEQFIRSAAEPQIRQSKRKRARRIAVGLAAAVLFALPVSVYAYGQFLHRDNVEHYIAGAELLEEKYPDTVKNYVTENFNYRITVDAALSDGHNLMMILTNEAKTPAGLATRAYMNGCPEVYLTYADGTPGPFELSRTGGEQPITGVLGAYAYERGSSGDPFGFTRTVTVMSCDNIDPEKDVKIEFFADKKWRASAVLYFWKRDWPELLQEQIPDFDFDRELTNDLDGLECTLQFAPNVDCIPLVSADGTEVFLSAFELYSPQGGLFANDENYVDYQSFYFITQDGEKQPLDFENYPNRIGTHTDTDCDYLIFGEMTDPNAYAGVGIAGREYFKVPSAD